MAAPKLKFKPINLFYAMSINVLYIAAFNLQDTLSCICLAIVTALIFPLFVVEEETKKPNE